MMTGPIEYTVVRELRKTISIKVSKDGKVTVKAPLFAPVTMVNEFVERHRDWIRSKVSIRQDLSGRARPLDEGEIARMKKKAKTVMKRKLDRFAPLMGVDYRYMKITSARRRWGSCNSKGGICFSYRTMLLNDEQQDYIAVHELAHRKHMDHSRAVYGEIAKVMPDYRRIEKSIKNFEGLDLY